MGIGIFLLKLSWLWMGCFFFLLVSNVQSHAASKQANNDNNKTVAGIREYILFKLWHYKTFSEKTKSRRVFQGKFLRRLFSATLKHVVGFTYWKIFIFLLKYDGEDWLTNIQNKVLFFWLTWQSVGGWGDPSGTTWKTQGLDCSPRSLLAQQRTCPCSSPEVAL